jgi:hypothetical protein
MGAVKTFRVKQGEAVEPLNFELEFQPLDPDAEPRVEQFTAYGKATAGATLALASVARYDLRGRQVPDMNGMMEFFRLIMPPTDYERMRALFEDTEWEIEMDTVGDIFSWLIEETAGRPTRRSRRSSRSRPEDGRIVHAVATEQPSDSAELTSSS